MSPTRPYLWLLLLLTAPNAWAAAPPPPREPFKAVVLGPTVLMCSNGGTYAVSVQAKPLGDGDGGGKLPLIMAGDDMPLRWHTGHGAFYAASAFNPGLGARVSLEPVSNGARTLHRAELPHLLAGRLKPAPEAPLLPKQGSPPDRDYHPLPALPKYSPAGRVYWQGGACPFVFRLHVDYQPTGPLRVRQFVLTDVAGGAGKADSERIFEPDGPFDEADLNAPRWSFRAYSADLRWDTKVGYWAEPLWRLDGELPVAFREPFFFVGAGDDWYFLTESGRLFRSPPPAKAGKRTLAPVWDDARRPVVGQVQDGKAGRTFLFTAAPPGGRPAWFEVGPRPRPTEYDPPARPAGGPDGPALDAARVLKRAGLLAP